VELSPVQTAEAIHKAKKLKLGTLHRDYRIWQQLNCDLVEDENGYWGYQLKSNSTTAPPEKPDLDTVTLTHEEASQALEAMQTLVWSNIKSLHFLAEQQAQAQAAQQARPTVTAEQLYQWAQASGRHLGQQRRPAFNFVLDAHNQLVFELLCYYFAGDKRFETVGRAELNEHLSLEKGIALLGGVGRGKTVMMEAFRNNPLRPYGLVSARKVAEVFREDLGNGEGKRVAVVSDAQWLYRGRGARFLCFDDVAREESKVQYMADKVNPIATIILDRADRLRTGQLPGWATHFTSNNPLVRTADDGMPADMPSLTDLYGAPAVDRLYELCNILQLKGESRRG